MHLGNLLYHLRKHGNERSVPKFIGILMREFMYGRFKEGDVTNSDETNFTVYMSNQSVRWSFVVQRKLVLKALHLEILE